MLNLVSKRFESSRQREVPEAGARTVTLCSSKFHAVGILKALKSYIYFIMYN